MKHVSIRFTGMGNGVDPRPYVEALPSFADELPHGARDFATDPGHYDFHGKRCVKDLELREVRFDENDVIVEFRHNCFKHEEDLTIRYVEVSEFTADFPRYGVILDEILPAPEGCSHEIVCLSGSVRIVARDLVATWSPAGGCS
ncbi:hypothetical protein JIG36_07545 [Actinoplanes sp. LDG1-06]|uniref:Uncharacterized protein n=1 Tax=Paractinoplanes ovalisporus TaxID=2810368 RepID=A0ABS2A6D8_9ACTN|nr:hypothetical protein [Actinoplanes ovalisporus]MBM2615417.1 hypothetical protein [Actinoplanes ovalisporus]